jgi:hypothetical protein
MSDTPTNPTPDDGRDPATGRFRPGWKGGPGNPHARRVGELRAKLLAAVSDEQWTQILTTLIEKAIGGEQWAVREVLDRTLGKPIEHDLIERLEQLETLANEQAGATQ